MSIHRFRPDPDVPDYCRCGFHKLHKEHDVLDVDALVDLYKACKCIVSEDAAGEISIGAIEDCQSAISKAEGQE